MCLQTTVLNQYKMSYPNDKLKDIASRTQIQMTRVFRILNGSEMKIKEYEAFETVIPMQNRNSEFLKVSQECIEKLSKERKSFLMKQMQHSLKIHFLNSMFITSNQNNIYA